MTKKVAARAGFTLVETLAALAITSVIILSSATLLHQNIFFFDHGTRTVDRNEQLALAIESLTRDFGAARFIPRKTENKVAFFASPASEDAEAKILFITSGGKAAGPQGEEIVSLTIEPGDPVTQLVRRRASWRGPHTRLEDAQPGDAVILLKGKFGISFDFSERTDEGKLIWHDSWSGENGLPHSVRLNLRDDATGAELLVRAEFVIHADAPVACAAGEVDCLKLAQAGANPAAPPSAPQQQGGGAQ